MLKVEDCFIPDLKIIKLAKYGDDRGFFIERFKLADFKKHHLPTNFVQDNHSRSEKNVVRGLHYQFEPAQGKLVGCTKGEVFDVAVDLRVNSKTFGKWFGLNLDQQTLLWIPAGFAHGFCAISDEPADLYYKITGGEYNPEGEGGIMWNDPEININWPVADAQISKRDKKQQTLQEYIKNPVFF